MAHSTKKQRQERLMAALLRRLREAPPGERVYMAVGDRFEAAEVRDLNEVRTARRAAVDRGDDADKRRPARIIEPTWLSWPLRPSCR